MFAIHALPVKDKHMHNAITLRSPIYFLLSLNIFTTSAFNLAENVLQGSNIILISSL